MVAAADGVVVVLQLLQEHYIVAGEDSRSKAQVAEDKDREQILQQVGIAEEVGEPFDPDSRGLQRERCPDRESDISYGLPWYFIILWTELIDRK